MHIRDFIQTYAFYTVQSVTLETNTSATIRKPNRKNTVPMPTW